MTYDFLSSSSSPSSSSSGGNNSNKADTDALESLHSILVTELTKRVRTGKATPADLSVARQLLKDNNISCDGLKNPQLGQLVDSLPADLSELEQ